MPRNVALALLIVASLVSREPGVAAQEERPWRESPVVVAGGRVFAIAERRNAVLQRDPSGGDAQKSTGQQAYGVDATPGTCVKLAVATLMPVRPHVVTESSVRRRDLRGSPFAGGSAILLQRVSGTG